jgi:hypothetical protein
VSADQGADGLKKEVPVQQQAGTRKTPGTGALGAAEREWIRKQGQVARAIEAARRRGTGRFSRMAAPPGAARDQPVR